MEQEKATQKVAEIQAWLEHNGETAGALAPLVSECCGLMETQTTDEDRDKVWASIRALLSTLGDKSPIKRGKGSSLNAEQMAVVSAVSNRLQTAFATITEFDLIQQVFPRSTRDGQYADVEAYADHMASKAESNMKRAIRENRWDGLMDGDSIVITPAEPKSTDDGGENQG